jgi:hypothetical protein
MDNDKGLLDLADVLHQLGDELRRAGDVDEPIISWYGATVEVESVVEKQADGRVRFYVVSAGGGVSGRNTVKVTVNLAPTTGQAQAAGM